MWPHVLQSPVCKRQKALQQLRNERQFAVSASCGCRKKDSFSSIPRLSSNLMGPKYEVRILRYPGGEMGKSRTSVLPPQKKKIVSLPLLYNYAARVWTPLYNYENKMNVHDFHILPLDNDA